MSVFFKGDEKRLIAQYRLIVLKPGKAHLKYRPEIPVQKAHNEELHDRIDRKECKTIIPGTSSAANWALFLPERSIMVIPPVEYGCPAAIRGGA